MNLPEEEIKEMDILTDFDKGMVREQTPCIEALVYLAYRHNLKKVGELIFDYVQYKQKRDARSFYSFFKGCPVEVLDNTLNWIHPNEEWEELVKKEGIKSIGVVSRNSQRIILGHLNKRTNNGQDIRLVAANIPEINNGTYTGNVELIVELKGLAKLIGKRSYICGKEEKIALEMAGLHPLKASKNLYICESRRLF
jgi:hypothetical protein